jgi:hypothetical protein
VSVSSPIASGATGRQGSAAGPSPCSTSRSLAGAGALVRRYRKPTFAKPAPVDLRHEIATQCDLVIEALAD